MNDPYQILGVTRDASDREIKKAYRDLSRKYHPDSYAGNRKQKQMRRLKNSNRFRKPTIGLWMSVPEKRQEVMETLADLADLVRIRDDRITVKMSSI